MNNFKLPPKEKKFVMPNTMNFRRKKIRNNWDVSASPKPTALEQKLADTAYEHTKWKFKQPHVEKLGGGLVNIQYPGMMFPIEIKGR